MLINIDFKNIYNTSECNIIKDFFEKALANSIIYKRGVGYFTSGWISQNAKGLAKFIQNGGKAQYITSPILDKKDLNALQGKFNASILTENILKNIDLLEKELEENTRNLLGWLVYDGLLEFRFAIPRYDLDGGDFHDKFGIFIDKKKNMVTFTGSMNESRKGFLNYESITVFCSWKDQTSKTICTENLKRFQKLWDNEDPNILVYEINDVIEKKLINFRTSPERPYTITKKSLKKLEAPIGFVLRPYQKKAIKSWLENNGKGILAMATGSGKTKTALYTIVKLLENYPSMPVLIVVPFNHLLEQWKKEGEDFNIKLLPCNSNYKWENILSSKITDHLYNKEPIFIITTTNTFKTTKFQKIINKLPNFFLIVDEVHNFGSKDIINHYPDKAIFRLGLSATPVRHFDEYGTQKIIEYFDKIVYEFSLKEGIENGFLTEYYYYPIFVNLTEKEEEKILEISQKISKFFRKHNEDDNIPDSIKNLLIKRAKIIESAENKKQTLKKLLIEKNLINSKKNLFYVSSAIKSSEKKKIREIDTYLHLLKQIGMNVEKFTAEENKWERKNLIFKLQNEFIDGLVAIRCLDEGIDIPSVERAFILASTSNPKEFIQRRGRILRKSPGKDFAYIYDFIVIPNFSNWSYQEYEKNILTKELKRVQEFAFLAKNFLEIEEKIFKIKKMYNILYI